MRRNACGGALLGLALALALSLPSGRAAAPRVEPDLAALGKLAKLSLAPPPAWSGGQAWSLDEIAAEFKKFTDRPPNINAVQTSFVRPNHQWLKSFNDWFMRLQKTLKLTYQDEVWDCDNFAQSFVAFADMMAMGGGGVPGPICVGWATVVNRRAFGGIAASAMGGHAVVIVGTTEGLFVIEPQSGKMASLKEYPNRDSFVDVNL